MLIPLEIASFGVDSSRNTPVIILREIGGSRSLALAIDGAEASMLAINTLGVSIEKPLPVDLGRGILDALGGRLERLVLSPGSTPDTMNGRLQVRAGTRIYLIDCAPSSGLVFAVRCNAPVFARETLLEKASDGTEDAALELRRRVASMDTIDFGRYHLE